MTVNQELASLCFELPPDIARRKAAGDLEGALRLIDRALEGNKVSPDMAARLRCERIRLERLPVCYPYPVEEAKARLRKEWPDVTDAQFDYLLDAGRIDWRYINGQLCCHSNFVNSLRRYREDAPGMPPSSDDNSARMQLIERMEKEGGAAARITIHAEISAGEPSVGKHVQAWLPIPAPGPMQSEIEILDSTPGARIAPEDAPQRTIYWESTERDSFEVTYRYLIRTPYVDASRLTADPVQPSFCLEEEAPYIVFTPYLRALCARIVGGLTDPLQKAKAIFDYVINNVDYRFQPDYLQLDSIADQCARELRGDCGVMAVLFIALCRIAGIPARWESGLNVRPNLATCHDWARFYIAPHGWLWADPSYGSIARTVGDIRSQSFYFGNLEPWRMIANNRFFAPLTPPDPGWRADPTDNQLGEMTIDGRGLNWPDMHRAVRTVDYTYLPY